MTRVCYWSPDYLPPDPFCLSSKMTDYEATLFFSFQADLAAERELNYFQSIATGRKELRFSSEIEDFDAAVTPERGGEGGNNCSLSLKKPASVAVILKEIKNNYVFSLQALSALKTSKSWVLYNIPTIAAIEAVTPIKRSDFLSR